MKLKKRTLHNYKAIKDKEFNFKGCSALVIGGNGLGKSSALKDMFDRLRSEKCEELVHRGEDKGFIIDEYTDGSKVEWHFTKKNDRVVYITENQNGDEVKQTSGVIGQIGEKYYGSGFDIDQFLQSSPKKKRERVEQLLGLDLTEIEQRYQQAYDDRRAKNREYKRLKGKDLQEPEKVDKPDINSAKNNLRLARRHNKKIAKQENKVGQLQSTVNNAYRTLKNSPFEDCLNKDKVKSIIEDAQPNEEKKDLADLEQQLEDAQEQQRKFDSYKRDMRDYSNWQGELEAARQEYQEAKDKVLDIETEKQKAIAEADMPKGFSIEDGELRYNGFAFDEKQIATSAKYIAALKLGFLALGKIKTIHFDASTLDKGSFNEVNEWANKHDLQLLIEKPDWDQGEIKYELIEN